MVRTGCQEVVDSWRLMVSASWHFSVFLNNGVGYPTWSHNRNSTWSKYPPPPPPPTHTLETHCHQRHCLGMTQNTSLRPSRLLCPQTSPGPPRLRSTLPRLTLSDSQHRNIGSSRGKRQYAIASLILAMHEVQWSSLSEPWSHARLVTPRTQVMSIRE